MKLQMSLDSWIIQDGNYDDFSVGQRRDFALEFGSRAGLQPTAETSAKSMMQIKDDSYDVCGQVVVSTDDWYAIDFGVIAYNMDPPIDDPLHVGQMVSGHLGIRIDPYPYMEYLHTEARAVSMIYSWEIARIRIETAPWIETISPSGTGYRQRDATKLSWRDIEHTDGWNDDDGHAWYLLDISLVDARPKTKIEFT